MVLSDLPTEIVEEILSNNILECTDIVNFSRTCHRFRDICRSNEIWHRLFKRNFRNLHEKFQLEAQCINWREEFCSRYTLGKKTDSLITSMSCQFYQQTELSSEDFKTFDEILLESNPQFNNSHLYVLDHIRSLLGDSVPDKNLTKKYYGAKVARHINNRILSPSVVRFSSSETSDFDYLQYEEILILIAQWCQPDLHVDKKETKASLDQIAQRIFRSIVESGHCSQGISTIEDLQKSVKDVQLCRRILDETNRCLNEEGFTGNSENYYLPANSFVNKVLETKLGIPISLSLIYLSITGRLGIRCEPINFPRHFLLRWMEHPGENEEVQKYTYIDVFNGGTRMSANQALGLLGSDLVQPRNPFQLASPVAAAQRMMRNLISIGASHSNNMRDSSYTLLRSSLEFMLLINSDEVPDFSFMLSRVYLQLNINHEETIRMLSRYNNNPGLAHQVEYLLATCQMQQEEKSRETKEIVAKKRDGSFPNGEIRLKVGTVALHKRYHYKCVVYGWDKRCKASMSWIRQMGVDRLPRKDNQPFYNVLVEDGSNRYAADENLEECEPARIEHSEVGKYFKEFSENSGYIPNEELKLEYPDD